MNLESKFGFLKCKFVFLKTNLYVSQNTFVTLRCESETSDTASTDEDHTWGGLGKFEYSTKSLPHALLHYPEMIVRGGHHGAYCTSAVEQSHIRFNKRAATFTKTESSLNQSEDNMLDWNLRQQTYAAVRRLHDLTTNICEPKRHVSADDEGPTLTLSERLSTDSWENDGGVPPSWKNNFVGRTVRLTRNELLHLLGNKLRITGSDRRQLQFDDSVLLQMRKLTWEFFGVLTTPPRKLVATAPRTSRRDFVRLEDDVETRGTCLSAQLIMFVHLSGFDSDDGVPPVDGEDSVTYALVRWLTAHPNALLRDDMLRPMCPAPLDINHALWKFAEEDRPLVTPAILNKHITSYPGKTMAEKIRHMRSEKRAWFGLVEVECIQDILNCTYVDNDLGTVLQTITLPFQ